MDRELEKAKEAPLQQMQAEAVTLTRPEFDLVVRNDTKIPLSNLAACGVAFQSLMTLIQTAANGPGGSGLYYVNTMGKTMFNASGSKTFIGSLKSVSGGVGGGQARMTPLACDPTMLFMAAALMAIEKKLDMIQETQKEILGFLEEKERAALKANLNTLDDVLSNYKYNWNNEKYKTNKHILVQQIKRESETSMIQNRDLIMQKMRKYAPFQGSRGVESVLSDLLTRFREYQMALYLYAYSSFLEVMLLGNFSEGYLQGIEKRIEDESIQYRELYTECYDRMENRLKKTLPSGVLNGLAAASKFVGNTIARTPAGNKTLLDENLIETGKKMEGAGEKRIAEDLGKFASVRLNVTAPFVKNIRALNELHNKPVAYLIDKENIYVHQ